MSSYLHKKLLLALERAIIEELGVGEEPKKGRMLRPKHCYCGMAKCTCRWESKRGITYGNTFVRYPTEEDETPVAVYDSATGEWIDPSDGVPISAQSLESGRQWRK